MRPHILVTQNETPGLRSLAHLHQSITHGHARALWQRLHRRAEAHLQTPPLLPTTPLPDRDPDLTRHANPDYVIVQAAGEGVMETALAALITEDRRYAEAALEQMRVLFDEKQWPEWRDQAHHTVTADLRTGQLSQALALAYDWLHPLLSTAERTTLVAGIDHCGIQRYLTSVAEDAWWLHKKNNWQTCVVGGLGVAGMALGDG